MSAVNYFGLRHGLETLFQLVEYDNVAGSYIVLNDVAIRDRPEFPHRGVILDTGRNFVELEHIQRLIDAMAMTKVGSSFVDVSSIAPTPKSMQNY